MMDTSKEYIKMCDRFEVQEHHIPTEGDIYGMIYMGVNIELIIGQTPPRADKKDNRDYFKNASQWKWLPRQDQIQEMLWGEFDNPIMKVSEFVDFMNRWLWLDFKTVEQQLLAFYMHEKHGKIWNGKKWDKVG